MVRLDDGRYIIGFDNGYQFGKTARSLFDNGVHAMGKVEPSVMEHTLKHRRRFYKVGEGRAAITEDKVSDEDARLLTMAAVAKELSVEGIRKARIVLAVGLPFSDYGREKGQLLEYYGQEPVLRFEFEGTRYDVEICRTLVFPQCYSAVAPRLGNMKGDYLVVDVGSKTTDVVYLEEGIPVERRCVTIERAMVKWMRQIQGSLQVQQGKDVPEGEILKAVLKKEGFLPRACAGLVRKGIREQVHMLELELEERGYRLDYMNVIYVGGGAAAVRNFTEHRPNVAYDCDIHANAKGYEFLAHQILKRQGGGMMSDERVVTLRFQEQRAMDMELYRRLEDGKKETGLSMPAYVKGLLRQHFKSAERAGTDVGVEACMERIREIVHGELACQGAVLAGTLEKIAEGFPERMKNAAQTGGPPESGEALPGYSDSFPEGFDSVLERFM